MRPYIKSLVLVTCLAIASLPANAGFFGPSKAVLTGDALAQKLQSQALVVDVSGGSLDVRSKAAAIGGFVLGFVLSSAMASGGVSPGVSAQQLQQTAQANMQIAAALNSNFQTAFTSMAASQAAKSAGQVAKEGPVSLVAQQVVASLAQNPSVKVQALAAPAKVSPSDLQLRIVQKAWLLDFSMTSSDYTLSHDIEVSLYQKQADTIYFAQECKGPIAEKKPKEDWEKDDFAAVAFAATAAGNQCAQKVIAALGLQPVKPLPKPLATENLPGSEPASTSAQTPASAGGAAPVQNQAPIVNAPADSATLSPTQSPTPLALPESTK